MSEANAAQIDALSKGLIASRNLQEILKIDFHVLLEQITPGKQMPSFEKEGISRKMVIGGEHLLTCMGASGLESLALHKSDTARGLAVFGLAKHLQDAPIPRVLTMVRQFAADSHFGVREWAWLAVRPRLTAELPLAISLLAAWTKEADVNLRRFAVEALRPRGVWCKHIAELRSHPELGLPLLEPMRTEPEKYAQDSVSNWLNDASKDQAEWVKVLCNRWCEAEPGNAATKRISVRAQRSIS